MFELRLEPLGDIILSMKKVLIRLVAFDNGAARLLNVEGAVSSAGVEAADADASNNLLWHLLVYDSTTERQYYTIT